MISFQNMRKQAIMFVETKAKSNLKEITFE